ncbi:MAG TPA: metallophosphoesterase, partial [Bacteroidales bacterium]|nr:metallophosphoesterase [Bacteroidales bacterium]
MKRTIFFLFFIIVLLPLVGQTEKKIVLLHTNDLHSRLTGYAPESAYSPLSVNDDKTKGGFARIATILKTEKDNNRGNTLVINAGDFLMGTLFAGLEEKNGFQLRLMKAMGYDIVGLGNHEFDFGPDKLASIINASVKNGEIPSLLIGNTEFDEKDRRDDNLEKLFSDGVITRKR